MNSTEPFTIRGAILKSARLLSDEINIILAPYELNYSLWQVLYVIHKHHECTSICIADYLNVSKPSIAKRIQVLDRLDIVQFIPSHDKREKIITLSKHGALMYQECAQKIQDYEQQLLISFPTDDQKQVRDFLNSLLHILESSKQVKP